MPEKKTRKGRSPRARGQGGQTKLFEPESSLPLLIPRRIFLTKGVGKDKEKLASFEAALRDAGIASLNLVPYSPGAWAKMRTVDNFSASSAESPLPSRARFIASVSSLTKFGPSASAANWSRRSGCSTRGRACARQ